MVSRHKINGIVNGTDTIGIRQINLVSTNEDNKEKQNNWQW